MNDRDQVNPDYEIKVWATFGSAYQKESFEAALGATIMGLVEYYRKSHTGNSIGFEHNVLPKYESETL